MITRQDLSDFYVWVRKNNQHTPDEIVDFVHNSAVAALYESELVKCRNCEGFGRTEDKYSYSIDKCSVCDGKGKVHPRDMELEDY